MPLIYGYASRDGSHSYFSVILFPLSVARFPGNSCNKKLLWSGLANIRANQCVVCDEMANTGSGGDSNTAEQASIATSSNTKLSQRELVQCEHCYVLSSPLSGSLLCFSSLERVWWGSSVINCSFCTRSVVIDQYIEEEAAKWRKVTATKSKSSSMSGQLGSTHVSPLLPI